MMSMRDMFEGVFVRNGSDGATTSGASFDLFGCCWWMHVARLRLFTAQHGTAEQQL